MVGMVVGVGDSCCNLRLWIRHQNMTKLLLFQLINGICNPSILTTSSHQSIVLCLHLMFSLSILFQDYGVIGPVTGAPLYLSHSL